MRSTAWLESGSSGYLDGIKIILSIVSLSTVWFGFKWARMVSGMDAAIIAAGCCATWYELVDFGSRAMTEVVAAHLLLPGLYLGAYGEEIPEPKRLHWAGAFCGLALSLRIQLAPAVLFALVWFCGPQWRKRILHLGLGFALPIAIFGIVDLFTWSYPFQSFIRYFWVNAVLGRSKDYGTEPWIWYLAILVETLGPMLLFALIGATRSIFLGGVALVIFLSHSMLAHKEARFLYPLVPLVLTLGAIGIADLAPKLRFGQKSASSAGTITKGLIISVLLSVLLAPMFPHWANNSGAIVAFDQLSRDSTVCGLGLYRFPWYNTGGYAHLHRNVPMLSILNSSELAADSAAVNALVAPQQLSDLPQGFKLIGCWSGICLHKRSGECGSAPEGSEINAYLEQTGN